MKKSKLLMGLAGLSMLAICACSTEDIGGNSPDGNNNGGTEEPRGNGNNMNGLDCKVVVDPVYIERIYKDSNGKLITEIAETTKGYSCKGDNISEDFVRVFANGGNGSTHYYRPSEVAPAREECRDLRYSQTVLPYHNYPGTLSTNVILPAHKDCQIR
jgi:hypothetical protein